MLTILKRLYQQIIGGLHAILDRTKNPVNDARRILSELEEQIQHVENAASQMLAQRHRLEERRDTATAKIEEFGELAKQAQAKGDTDLARELLSRQMDHEEDQSSLAAQIEDLQPRLAAVRERLDELRRHALAAQRELSDMESRYAISKASIKTSKIMKDINGYRAGGELAKAREAIADKEALAKAVDEVNTTAEERLDQRVAAMQGQSRNAELEARLAKLAD